MEPLPLVWLDFTPCPTLDGTPLPCKPHDLHSETSVVYYDMTDVWLCNKEGALALASGPAHTRPVTARDPGVAGKSYPGLDGSPCGLTPISLGAALSSPADQAFLPVS